MPKNNLPPRLSDQQLFILASIKDQGGHVESLSHRVALEFDDEGNRILVPPDTERGEQRLEEGKTKIADLTTSREQKQSDHRFRGRRLQDSHSVSFSRALSRLEDRGLVRSTGEQGPKKPKRAQVSLTDDGKKAAKEVLRRHSDGRYDLFFEILD